MIATRQCRPIEIAVSRTASGDPRRIGRNTTDVLTDAWSRVTANRLPPVLLYTHANTIAFAMVSRQQPDG